MLNVFSFIIIFSKYVVLSLECIKHVNNYFLNINLYFSAKKLNASTCRSKGLAIQFLLEITFLTQMRMLLRLIQREIL